MYASNLPAFMRIQKYERLFKWALFITVGNCFCFCLNREKFRLVDGLAKRPQKKVVKRHAILYISDMQNLVKTDEEKSKKARET